MGFAVVACPACRRVQVVDLRHRRVACKQCRKALDPAAARSLHRGEDQEEARRALVRVSAQLGGLGLEDYARVLRSLEKEQPRTVEDALRSVAGGDGGEFAAEEFARAMMRLGVSGDPDRVLSELARANRVYEPRPGRYRCV